MKAITALGAFALAAIAVVTRGRAPTDPRATQSPVINSLDLLSYPFKQKVLELLELMRLDGFDAYVFETWRSPARALELEQRGTGIAKSQHTLGLAADIIDRKKYWKATPAFWAALNRHALKLGLGRVEGDPPHVQALPPSFDAQLRAMGPAAQAAFLAKRYQRVA